MEHYSNVVKAMIARSNARAVDIADKIQARAYYQFQYVPPAGPLPGWSMEQQTEDAINEIGNIAYSSDEIAREAREIAQQAYNAAQAAIEMATNALTAAQNAQQTADTALNTANTAVTKADNAQASADAAQKAADAAQKSANDAQTAADNAQSTANTAIENASQALSAANEAKASADQSNQRLDVLGPIVDTLRWYENVTDNIDFNTRVELERAFLQGTANTNGPVAGPGWLDVDDDYNETYIRQKFIAQADGACYVRFGTIVPDSSPIEVSSWTGWVKYALASELTSAVETINTSITSINGEITTIKGDITSIESDITELQGTFLPLTGGTVTGPIYLPSATPTTDTQAVTKKYVDDSVAGAGGGDVTAAGNNNFTGENTFNNSTNFGSYIAVRSGDGSSAPGVINLGRLSGSTVQGASLSAISTGQLNLTAGTGRNVVLQSREQQDAVNLAEFSTSQAIIYPNVLTIGMGSSGTVAMERGTEGDYRLHLVDNDVIVAGFNSNSNVAAFSAHQIIFNSDGVIEEWKLRNNTATILDYDGIAMHLRTGNSNVGLELGPGTSGWALQCPSNSTDVRVARRLYVGSQGGTGNGVISADNTENCL